MSAMLPTIKQQRLNTVDEIRQLEAALFAEQDSFAVMQRAAQSLFEVIVSDYQQQAVKPSVHVILGCGNNAGDGLLVAVYLQQAGFSITAHTVFDKPFSGDAAKALAIAQTEKLNIVPFTTLDFTDNAVIVEAIFGIGFDRAATGRAKSAIDAINQAKKDNPSISVYAVDVPAGIITDTGAALGSAVVADKTVTFIADKVGLHTADGRGFAGQVTVSTLGSDNEALKQSNHSIWRYHYDSLPCHLQHNTHKGDYGHVLMVGGGLGMFGAAALAAISALKVGVGKSSIYSHDDYKSQYHLDNTPLYEVMRCQHLSDLAAYSAVAIGPGLGRDEWGESVFQQTLDNTNCPLLIDADGLYHLAAMENMPDTIAVITPHEAEAARLLHISVDETRADKIVAVRELARRYHCVAVLKGSGTLISDGQQVWINSTGNACLATAGTGDVLAGMISGLLAQGFSPLVAASYGVYRHGLAADDYLAAKNIKSMRASELWDYL